MKIGAYLTHPAADLFPMMPESELRELADNIKARGLIEPIVILDGQILDGRNRAKACDMVGVEPRELIYSDERSPVEYVMAANKLRRHMTPSQLAAVAVEAAKMMAAEAKARQVSKLKQNAENTVEANLPQREKGRSTDIAAAAVGVSPRTVRDAKFVAEHSPEEFQKIKEGKTSVHAAKAAIIAESEENHIRTADEERERLDSLSSANSAGTVADSDQSDGQDDNSCATDAQDDVPTALPQSRSNFDPQSEVWLSMLASVNLAKKLHQEDYWLNQLPRAKKLIAS